MQRDWQADKFFCKDLLTCHQLHLCASACIAACVHSWWGSVLCLPGVCRK